MDSLERESRCVNGAARAIKLMTTILKNLALTGGLSAAIFLAFRAQDPAPKLDAAPPVRQIVSEAVEYRTITKNDIPLGTATENVVVYTVPKNKKLIIKSYRLPLGVAEQGGVQLSPLGLGLMVDERNTIVKTPRFAHDWEEIIHLDPGVEFPAGSRVVVRFAETVKGLSGSLFMNGELE